MANPAYYVNAFQKALRANGFAVNVDGYFGNETSEAALKALKELATLRAAGGVSQAASFTEEDRAALARIEASDARLEAGQHREEAFMTTYKEEVERILPKLEQQTLANAGVLQLMTSFVAQLRDLSTDPNSENVTALADAWESSLSEVQAAVVANTAAAPEPIVEPPAPEEPPQE
jgi:hypothetical protein